MLGKLVENATGTLGKSFVVLGLVPAAVVLIGVASVLYGSDAIPEVLESFDSDDALADAASRLLWLAATSLTIFTVRGGVLVLLEELPGTWLSPVRHKLVSNALKPRALRESRVERLEFAYTVLTLYAE